MPHDDPFAGKTAHADWAYYLDTSGTYTPELTATTTDPDLGEDGEAVGYWQRNGHWITGGMRFLFSGAGLDAGSGLYEYELPFQADSSFYGGSNEFGTQFPVGSAYLRDDDTSASNRIAIAHITIVANPSYIRLMREGTATSVGSGSGFSAEGDRHTVQFAYLADPAGLPS